MHETIQSMSMEMRGLRLTIFLALIATVSAGCASSQGFNRTSMIETLHVDRTADQNNQPFAHRDSRLSPPFRLGIFFADYNIPPGQSIQKVDWLSTDRSQLIREFAPLQEEQLLTETFVLMDATLRGEDIRGILQAGTRYGADMVLIVRSAAAVDRHNNRYALLYPTLLGAYLAPGTESDALIMVTGSLWAVRSEWHSPIHTVEGTSKVVGSAVLVEDNTALQGAKEQAIQALAERIVGQLRLLKEELHRAKPSSQ